MTGGVEDDGKKRELFCLTFWEKAGIMRLGRSRTKPRVSGSGSEESSPTLTHRVVRLPLEKEF